MGLLPTMQEALNLTPEDDDLAEIIEIVEWHERNAPRSLQKTLGPSEVGHPCLRHLGYKFLDVPRCNTQFGRDVLPAALGSAMHARLEHHFLAENIRRGGERYLTELRVEPYPGLTGSLDLYDKEKKLVRDWKILGDASFRKFKKAPSLTYRRQVQLYGRGMELLGYPVEIVSIVAIPKAGTLRGAHVYREPYNPAVAEMLEARWWDFVGNIDDYGAEKHPERVHWLPTVTPDQADVCRVCPWFDKNATPGPDLTSTRCAGPTATAAAPAA